MATIAPTSKVKSPTISSIIASNTYITQINVATTSMVNSMNISTQSRTTRSTPTVSSVKRTGTIVITSADPITPNSTQYWYMS